MDANNAGRTSLRPKAARSPHTTARTRPAGTDSKPTPAPTLYTGTCPVCGEADRLKVERRRESQAAGLRSGWRVFCRRAECGGLSSGDWLREVARIVNAPYASSILEDPVRWLADYLESEHDEAAPARLPSAAGVARCAELLLETADALAYITKERGLTRATLRRYQIGWNGRGAFTFPIYNARGQLVNWITRPYPTGDDGRKYVVSGGHYAKDGAVELYPRSLRDYSLPDGGWLLVEGLLDAALGRQHGLPVVTSTHGVNSFPPQCVPLVKGRKVYVMYDVGAEGVQRERVTELRAAGAGAWGVDLSVLGLSHGGDLSDYLLSGGSADELRWFIKRERRRAR